MGNIAGLLPILLIVVVMYAVLFRPQQKRMKAREAMIRSADIGDEVATVGGVIGRIVAVEGDGDVVCVEVDTDVELRVQRRGIGEIVTSAAADAPGANDADDADDAEEPS